MVGEWLRPARAFPPETPSSTEVRLGTGTFSASVVDVTDERHSDMSRGQPGGGIRPGETNRT